ncbi:MAG: alginate export family protein [Candidatus Hydrogenedentota bacterium]
MRKIMTMAVAVALVGATSYADLQNVEVGGSIRIRGNSYINPGADDANETSAYTEQRTTVNLSSDFSDDDSTFIEFDNYGNWGDDTRDIVGGDTGASGNSQANIYQAYVELGQVFDRDASIRIGRQEVQLGSEFLIGNNDTAGQFTGLSFDGITSRYNFGTSFNVTLLNLKVVEGNNAAFGDTDINLRGIYGSYTGIEDLVIDGYVLQLRTGNLGASLTENGDFYTYGARVAGNAGGFDYEVEVALQDGDMGSTTGPSGLDAEGMAVNAEVGYTFDTNVQPRIFLGYTLLEGPDGSDAGFNRLFSDWEYSEFLGNTDITNMNIYRIGFSIQATEKIGLSVVETLFELDEDIGGEDEVGSEFGLYATYAYSEDVSVEVGYAHFFNGDLIEDGVGTTEEDPDYLYAEISISF